MKSTNQDMAKRMKLLCQESYSGPLSAICDCCNGRSVLDLPVAPSTSRKNKTQGGCNTQLGITVGGAPADAPVNPRKRMQLRQIRRLLEVAKFKSHTNAWCYQYDEALQVFLTSNDIKIEGVGICYVDEEEVAILSMMKERINGMDDLQRIGNRSFLKRNETINGMDNDKSFHRGTDDVQQADMIGLQRCYSQKEVANHGAKSTGKNRRIPRHIDGMDVARIVNTNSTVEYIKYHQGQL